MESDLKTSMERLMEKLHSKQDSILITGEMI